MTTKFTDLTEISAVDVDDADVLALSDVSASASRKVTVDSLRTVVGAVELSQVQVEDAASTVFGTVSGQRLGQAISAQSDNFLQVRDEKAAGTDGGTFTSGAWQTRDLNTVKTNTISGASVSSNQITLPAGTYYIQAAAPALAVNEHVAKLRDTTAGADIIIGTAMRGGSGVSATLFSILSGRFTLAVTSVLELQHRCTTTTATDGLGRAVDVGVVEVYSSVELWKLS